MAKRKISCLSCRIKKVKCDGERPCSRCKTRQITCVYQKPGAVGRPPKNAVVNKLVLSRIATNIHGSKETNYANGFCREFIFENVSLNPVLAPMRYLQDSTQHGLDYYINTLFSTYFAKNTSLDHFIEERRNSAAKKHNEYAHVNPKIKIFDLTDYFTWMSADMANILMRRMSKLKLTYYTDLEFTRTALVYDFATTFFETPSGDSLAINPLNSLPPHQAVRLIECFFCIHPFSNLLNKSMLLQSYWTDTVDPLLLSVVYGTTMFKSQLLDGKPLELWDALNKHKRNPFLDYAHLLLSRATAESTPSKYQAVVLLALFEVTFGFPKRGMSLFALSYMLAAKLGLFDNTMPAGLNNVEKELILNTFWAAFETTIRGCIELEQIPRVALAHHEHPFPPPNIKLSKSHQYDVENNNPKLSKWYFYLVETFYIKSVMARFNCKLILRLPHSSKPVLPEEPPSVMRHFKEDSFAPYPKYLSSIEEGITNILNEFYEFNLKHRKDWSPLQVYTLDLFYSFYRISLYFLRKSLRQTDGRTRPFSLYQPHTPTELDLTDVDNVLHVHKAIPESIKLLNSTYAFLKSPANYYQQTDFLPRGIILSAVDSATQVLMYAYRLEESDTMRQHLEIAEAILSMASIWGNWETSGALKCTIHIFLSTHPMKKGKTAAESSLSPNNSVNPSDIGLFDDNSSFITSLLPTEIVHHHEPQPLSESIAAFHPVSSNPWLMGQELWLQDMNQILSSSDLLSMPFVDPPLTLQNVQQPQEHQPEFVHDILDGLF